jgi:CubicO group peptidase (beta-lactamase class C family)
VDDHAQLLLCLSVRDREGWDIDSPRAPGSAVCVIRHGQVAGIEYSGRRCHDGLAVDDETVWEAASLSKPVVAGHALRLASEGVIDLDEPLDVDLATLRAAQDPRWREVTARRVLTHTSGLPNWRGPLESARAAGLNIPVNPEVLAFAHAPGAFCYSGEGFEVLLHALSRRAGQSATDLLEQALLRFGMSHSSFLWQAAFRATAAVPHRPGGQALAKQHPGQPRAAGSLHTTMADYVGFALAVLGESADEIFRPAVLLDEIRGRSLGWGTVRTSGGHVAWQHGDNRGFKHMVGLRRRQGDGVVIFTNGDDGQVLCREVFRRALGAQPW